MTHYHAGRLHGPFRCPHCPRGARTTQGILNHVRWRHGREAMLKLKKVLVAQGVYRAVVQ